MQENILNSILGMEKITSRKSYWLLFLLFINCVITSNKVYSQVESNIRFLNPTYFDLTLSNFGSDTLITNLNPVNFGEKIKSSEGHVVTKKSNGHYEIHKDALTLRNDTLTIDLTWSVSVPSSRYRNEITPVFLADTLYPNREHRLNLYFKGNKSYKSAKNVKIKFSYWDLKNKTEVYLLFKKEKGKLVYDGRSEKADPILKIAD